MLVDPTRWHPVSAAHRFALHRARDDYDRAELCCRVAVMMVRTQITMDAELLRRARAKAAELGISFAEYVRRLVADDLREQKPKPDISILFDLCDSGEPTDIARDKDRMIGEAVWQDYLRKTGRTPRRRTTERANSR